MLPNTANGKLLKWVDKMIEEGICEATAPKLRAFLLHPTKSKLFNLELTVVVFTGKSLKSRNAKLEGDTFEYITGYDTVMHMGEAIKNPMTAQLKAELQKLAMITNGAPLVNSPFATTAAPTPTPTPTGTPIEILKSLPPSVFKTINVSVDSFFFNWSGDKPPPQPRYCGKPTSWKDETTGKEEIRIKWEKGRTDDGTLQSGYESTTVCLFSKLMSHGFRLEAFDDGAAAPTLSAVAPPAPAFLLSSTNFSDLAVLIARAEAIVSPAAKYFETSLQGKRGGQLARMKSVRFFNPLHVLANSDVTEADIDGLMLFRFSEHPKLKPKIEVRCCGVWCVRAYVFYVHACVRVRTCVWCMRVYTCYACYAQCVCVSLADT